MCNIIDKTHPDLLIFIDVVTLSITHSSESVKDIGIWVHVFMYTCAWMCNKIKGHVSHDCWGPKILAKHKLKIRFVTE